MVTNDYFEYYFQTAVDRAREVHVAEVGWVAALVAKEAAAQRWWWSGDSVLTIRCGAHDKSSHAKLADQILIFLT